MTFYLLQRHELRRPFTKELRLTEMFSLDYMGSAEFEWGAYAKAMRLIYSDLDNFVRDAKTVRKKGIDYKITVFSNERLLQNTGFYRHVFTFDEALQGLVLDNIHLKEPSHFLTGWNNKPTEFAAWTDIEHGVFITMGHKLSLGDFKSLVINSVKHYDEVKFKNEPKRGC